MRKLVLLIFLVFLTACSDLKRVAGVELMPLERKILLEADYITDDFIISGDLAVSKLAFDKEVKVGDTFLIKYYTVGEAYHDYMIDGVYKRARVLENVNREMLPTSDLKFKKTGKETSSIVSYDLYTLFRTNIGVFYIDDNAKVYLASPTDLTYLSAGRKKYTGIEPVSAKYYTVIDGITIEYNEISEDNTITLY